MKVALAGSSGLVGKYLTQFLLDDNAVEELHLFVRTAQNRNHPKIIEHVVDLYSMDKLQIEATFDAAFCSLGTTMKKAGSKTAFEKVDKHMVLSFAKFVQRQGCKHFSIVSSMGANPNSHIFYSRVKGVVEKELYKLHFNKLTIMRPSFILGPRGEDRFGEQIGKKLTQIISPLLIGSLRHYKPVHAEQIAKKMVQLWKSQTEKEVILLSGDILKP